MKKYTVEEWTTVLVFFLNNFWQKPNEKSDIWKIPKLFIINKKSYKKIQYARALSLEKIYFLNFGCSKNLVWCKAINTDTERSLISLLQMLSLLITSLFSIFTAILGFIRIIENNRLYSFWKKDYNRIRFVFQKPMSVGTLHTCVFPPIFCGQKVTIWKTHVFCGQT